MVKRILLFFALLVVITNAISQVKIAPTGNVGIGTSTPLTKMQIGSTWTFHDGAVSKIIALNSYYDGSNFKRITSGYATQILLNNSGDIKFQTASSGASNSIISEWNTVTMNNNGNVGIGTNNPTVKLQVELEGVAWERAIWSRVTNSEGCSYNLWSIPKNKDVFFACAKGWIWTETGAYTGSDINLKKNITPIEGALEKVLKLNGVKFQYIGDEEFRFGFIAQEVEKVLPEVVKDMPDSTKAMTYTDLIAVLTEAIKEQQGQINKLQAMIVDQEKCIKKFSEPLQETSQQTSQMNVKEQHSEAAKLFQNTPNPFTASTEIRFEIPVEASSAKLLIHNMQGAEIKSFTIKAKGVGSVAIKGSELSAGMYMYTLLVNNTVVDTKKMILTK